MNPFVVVPCSAAKAPGSGLPARDRYVGSFHRLAMAAALRITEPQWVRIASAHYGLLHLDDLTEPYDVRLDALSAPQARRWRSRVETAACDMWVAGLHGRLGGLGPFLGRPGAPLVLFTPAAYTDALLAAHPYFGRHAVRPLPFEGCRGIGEMRHVLTTYRWAAA